MTITFPVRLTSITDEANRLSPNRRKSSDGMLGDAAHRAEVSDHNPDANGVVHAVDISHSVPGAPYWAPGFGVFDVFAHMRQIVHDYVAATPTQRVLRWPWLAPGGGYLVWWEASMGGEVIFNPSVSLTVRYNGGYPHVGHTEHGHFSIGHNIVSENDHQPIFGALPPLEDDVTPQEVKIAVEQALGGVHMVNGKEEAYGPLAEVVKHYLPALRDMVCDELVSKPYDASKLGRVEIALKARLKSIYEKLGIPT